MPQIKLLNQYAQANPSTGCDRSNCCNNQLKKQQSRMKIGSYSAEKRKKPGMTQKQLAEKLGKSDKSVSKWERGICLPDVRCV